MTEQVNGQPDGEIYAIVENLGNESADVSEAALRVRDVLPHGLRAVTIFATAPEVKGQLNKRTTLPCSLKSLTCTMSGTNPLFPYNQFVRSANRGGRGTRRVIG